jgi:hypothetical protein
MRLVAPGKGQDSDEEDEVPGDIRTVVELSEKPG